MCDGFNEWLVSLCLGSMVALWYTNKDRTEKKLRGEEGAEIPSEGCEIMNEMVQVFV